MTVSPHYPDPRPAGALLRTADGAVEWTALAASMPRAAGGGLPAGDGSGTLVPVPLEDVAAFVERTGRPFVATHAAALGVMLAEADLVAAPEVAQEAVERCLDAGLLPALVGAGLGYALLPDLRCLPWGMVWPALMLPASADDESCLALLAGIADAARSEDAEVTVFGDAGQLGLARSVGAHQLAVRGPVAAAALAA